MSLVKPKTTQTTNETQEKETIVEQETAVETQNPEKETIVEQETAVETQNPEKETIVEQETAVAVVEPTNSEVATSKPAGALTGMKALLDEQANLGFEDIEISQFSFDRIKLTEGSFWQGEEDIGDSFKFIPLSNRATYIIKQDTSEDAQMFYSYDPQGLTTADGQSSKAIRDGWKEEGYDTPENPIIVLKYMEIMAQLVVNGEAGDVVSLSVPPSSRARFGQVPVMAKMRFGVDTNGVIVEASVGAKVGEGKKAFRPWNFKVVSKA